MQQAITPVSNIEKENDEKFLRFVAKGFVLVFLTEAAFLIFIYCYPHHS
jgi:hypothetical protein